MKSVHLIFLIFFSVLSSGQHKIFLYHYEYVPDSTNQGVRISEVMELRSDGIHSYYFSNATYKADSLIMDNYYHKKQPSVQPTSNQPQITDRVIKNCSNPNEVQIIINLNITKYAVTDKRLMNWKITSKTDQFLGYKIQKAETNFGGRRWIAWFTEDIPIQDGPYKFRGLPGLILKIHDSENQHFFAISEIKNSPANFKYPTTELERGVLSVNQSSFRKLYKNYRSNPVADLEGKIPNQSDQYGNIRTGNEILKEFKEKELKRINKDNNLIEIDLLK